MDTRVAGPSLTAREREVAQLIGRGLTNRQIADELAISDRTVGAHVQNILNKLGATNRAQIAAWTAQSNERQTVRPAHPVTAPAPSIPPPRVFVDLSPTVQIALVAMAAALFTLIFPADHLVAPPAAAAAVSSQPGKLVFEAHFDPSAGEFAERYVIGDPSASAVTIADGALELAVLKQGGNTGVSPIVPSMPAFFAELEVSVKPGATVAFWITFNQEHPQHLLDIETAIETMQLAYFEEPPMAAVGPEVPIEGLQWGRTFSISMLVKPPLYRVFLDGVRVIDVTHPSPRRPMAPGFGIFGDGGTVRVGAMRVYAVD